MWPYLPHLIERPVPRYTSYPTAVQFNAEVDANRYRDWLAALPPTFVAIFAFLAL